MMIKPLDPMSNAPTSPSMLDPAWTTGLDLNAAI
jgi:hypothetical protein